MLPFHKTPKKCCGHDLLRLSPPGRQPHAMIHCMNFMDSPQVMEAGSVDLAVHRHRYLNNITTFEVQRPHLYWLGLSTLGDLRKLEDDNVGKYWQTVGPGTISPRLRGRRPLKLLFSRFERPESDKSA